MSEEEKKHWFSTVKIAHKVYVSVDDLIIYFLKHDEGVVDARNLAEQLERLKQ